MRSSDLSARFGGEEFAVILPSTALEGALAAAEKLRVRIECLQIEHANSSNGFLTVSIGAAAMIPQEIHTWSELIHAADTCLYRAKQGGKNRVVSAMDSVDNDSGP